MFATILLLSLAVQIFFFVFAAAFRTDTVTDLSYGLTFIFIAWYLSFVRESLFFAHVLVVLVITLWGARLAGYLLIRILTIKKDKRFDGIREHFLKFAAFWLFQGISVWIILLPVTALFINQTHTPISNSVFFFGIIVSLLGLAIETVADHQKFRFKKEAKNNNTWTQVGLWKFARHPNYFGELLVWWGLFLAIISFDKSIFWTILGPIHITLLLLYITGIPTLEKKYEKKFGTDPKYIKYKRSTNLLVPIPIKVL